MTDQPSVEHVDLSGRKHTVFVVFTDRQRVRWRWWHPFCRKGFGHVYVIQPQQRGITTTDFLHSGIINLWHDCLIADALNLALDSGHRVLRYEATLPLDDWPRGVITCVSVVKAIVGLRSLAVTPYQLYGALLKAGADELGVTHA